MKRRFSETKTAGNGIEITNNATPYLKIMGKMIEIVYFAASVLEANRFMERNPGIGVIAEDLKSGIIFLARNSDL